MALIKLNKLHEDSTTLFIDEIRLGSGSTLKIKDADGFTVAEFLENGSLKLRGGVRRI